MVANFAAINSVYNYYLTTYAPKSDTKFDTHKKSELRSVYNSIVSINKEAPLYIVDKSQDTKEYAVGLKENARAFRNTIASLGGLSEDKFLDKKVASSSNESLATAQFIGEVSDQEFAPSFDLSVQHLATPQTNVGKFLPSNYIYLPEDTYSFDVSIKGLNYEFQYNVTEGDTNKSLQEKLSRLINNSGIGLSAEVLDDGAGNSALKITSVNTGKPTKGDLMFNISDTNTTRTKGSVNYFGLDNVDEYSTNSQFSIGGKSFEANGNTFTVEKMYEVTIKRVSEPDDESATISLKADVESLASNISKLVEGYNSFVDTADSYRDLHPKSGRLVNEMANLASIHGDELGSLGLSLQTDGRIKLDKTILLQAANEGSIRDNVPALKSFTGSMLRKANQVSINPMDYADKTIVAYKNPGHNYATPYVTSAYTGMMFNGYC